jgi:hypothetical protein
MLMFFLAGAIANEYGHEKIYVAGMQEGEA